jgi:hypothetical protein
MTGFTPIGLVEGVYLEDPTIHRGADSIAFDPTGNGLQIRYSDVQAPWIRFQMRVPLLTAEIWDATQSFTPADEETTVVVIPETSRGEYPAYPTVGAARASIITAERVDILSDANGSLGTFWADPTYVDDGFDVTGFVDFAGRAYRRVQRV